MRVAIRTGDSGELLVISVTDSVGPNVAVTAFQSQLTRHAEIPMRSGPAPADMVTTLVSPAIIAPAAFSNCASSVQTSRCGRFRLGNLAGLRVNLWRGCRDLLGHRRKFALPIAHGFKRPR